MDISKRIVTVINVQPNVKLALNNPQTVLLVMKVDKMMHLHVHAHLNIQKLIISVLNVAINVTNVVKVQMIVELVLTIVTEPLLQIVFVKKDIMTH